MTVSTKEKREFLATNFGIPENRMFNSRNTKFAEEIRRETNGRGVDVILNSLTGELLDETWRLTADGGTMIEIGKQDIVERNTLAMEPFDRNCSYRAIDLSYTQDMTDEVVDKLVPPSYSRIHHFSSIFIGNVLTSILGCTMRCSIWSKLVTSDLSTLSPHSALTR